MKKTFGARRVPRQIGQDDDTDAGSAASGDVTITEESSLKRPLFKPRKSSTLRRPHGPSSIDDVDDAGDAGSVVVPKRATVSRFAIERNASTRSAGLAAGPRLHDSIVGDDRPSYSASSLQELKDSTPTTPREASMDMDGELDAVIALRNPRDLDIEAKFGSRAQLDDTSIIPSAAEIAEKKARRARLALEQQADEYISLDVDDPDLDDDDNVMREEDGRLVLKPKDKYKLSESRLVRDDEDVMENFDEFTEDGGIALGRKAEIDAARKRKQAMAAQIAEAEGQSDSDSNVSERERNEAFEAAQTKHGTSRHVNEDDGLSKSTRPRTPPIITPLPTLDGALERLRKQLAEMQTARTQKVQEMEHLRREKTRLDEEEIRIQNALKETAQKFESLRREKGIGVNGETSTMPVSHLGYEANGETARASTTLNPSADADQMKVDAEDENDNEDVFRPGLGMSTMNGGSV